MSAYNKWILIVIMRLEGDDLLLHIVKNMHSWYWFLNISNSQNIMYRVLKEVPAIICHHYSLYVVCNKKYRICTKLAGYSWKKNFVFLLTETLISGEL